MVSIAEKKEKKRRQDMINIAINGFGRIGKSFLRAVLSDEQAKEKIYISVINIGPAEIATTAHLFKYDSLMGTYPGRVVMQGQDMLIDDYKIPIIAQTSPEKSRWSDYKVEWVIESSGKFTDRQSAQRHLQAGAQAVLITAPAKEEDITIIPGINDKAFDASKHHIVALGSCTTNAFIPMLKVIHDAYGIEYGFMTTIHAYTNSQVLLDIGTDDVRRSRAATLNIIPTTTGVANLIDTLIPDLQGRIQVRALRVPVPKVSLIDFCFEVKSAVAVEDLNQIFIAAANRYPLKGIVDVTHEELVSTDFNGNAYSVVIDAGLTQAAGSMGKLFGWYDNEWAFSIRLKDFLLKQQ